MINRLRHLLASPTFDDEQDTRTGRTLHQVLLATLAIQAVAIAVPLYPGPTSYRLSVAGWLIAFPAVAIALIARRRLLAASYVTVAGFWLLLTVVNAVGAGLRAVSFSAYVICVILASWLIGPVAGFVVGAMSAGVGLVMLVVERAGWVRFGPEEATPAQLWVIQSLILVFTVAFLAFAVRSARRALSRASREAAVRARTDLQLEQSEARFRQVVEAAPMGTHLYSIDDRGQLVLTGASPAADRILGLDHAGLVGLPIEQAFPGAIGTDIPARYRRIALEGGTWHAEQVDYEDERLNGAYEVHAFQTAPGAMAAMFVDITARRRAEEERASLAAAVEQAGDMVVLLDASGRVKYVNPAFERLTGVSREVIVSSAPEAAHGAVDDPAFAAGLRAILRRGVAWSGRLVDRARDGTTITVEASASPIRSAAGELLGHVAVMRDISERLALEDRLRQSQKMESVGQLAGGVAHDFNNLLSPILGYADMLLAEFHPDDPRARRIEVIREAAERASGLTRQLLSLSRRQVLDIRTVDLNQIIEDFSKILGRSIRDDIGIDLQLTPDATTVEADTSRIEQILMNLVLNARDAMPTGGRITIETFVVRLGADLLRDQPDLRGGSYVVLRLTDTGSGMPPEVAAHVFEPFFTTKEKDRGTGLGLATVYGIVRQHNGAITVRSEPGKGSTFTIHLPAATASAPAGD